MKMNFEAGRQVSRKNPGTDLLLVFCILMPLIIFFLLPNGGLLDSGMFFFLVLMFCFWLISLLPGTFTATPANRPPMQTAARPLADTEHPAKIRELMDVRLAEEDNGVRIFHGNLREPAASVYAKLKHALGTGSTPMVQADERFGASILLPPKPENVRKVKASSRGWINGLLFVLTVLTTTWAGAAYQGVDLLREPRRFTVGLTYSLGLLAILGIHELGHYFVARYHRIQVTPPFFIPVPFALGTFGAFIKMRSPAENRRDLFDVAVAGPLAGLVIAISALLIGLHSSTVLTTAAATGSLLTPGGTSVGSSVLLALLAKLSLGPALLEGHVLRLSPLAFAGWLGLMITALNLMPIGQLDGGHIAHAMFGRRAGNTIGSVAKWTLLLMGLCVWPGLLMWAVIVFFIAGRDTPPLENLTPLTPERRWLGCASFAILVLILAPLPHALWSTAGIQ